MSQRLSGYMEMGGETLVVLFAALWITHLDFVPYGFAAGSVLFAVKCGAKTRLCALQDRLIGGTKTQYCITMCYTLKHIIVKRCKICPFGWLFFKKLLFTVKV